MASRALQGKSAAFTTKLPWTDRHGRFAPLKALALLLVSLPALWLLSRFLFLDLGPRPLTEAIHRLGDWTVYLLLATLAISPARRLFNMPKLIQIRRIIGLAALAYALAHVLFYVADSKFQIGFVATEILFRVYLTIGFAAVLGLIALGATSTHGMIRRMGAAQWNTLHRLIYLITPLTILHYFMQSKLDVSQPTLMGGFFLWLMGYRLLAKRLNMQGFLPLVALSLLAALATALTEGAWYGLATGVGFRTIFSANFDFAMQLAIGIRPAWWVLAAGLSIAVATALDGWLRGRPARGRISASA